MDLELCFGCWHTSSQIPSPMRRQPYLFFHFFYLPRDTKKSNDWNVGISGKHRILPNFGIEVLLHKLSTDRSVLTFDLYKHFSAYNCPWTGIIQKSCSFPFQKHCLKPFCHLRLVLFPRFAQHSVES